MQCPLNPNCPEVEIQAARIMTQVLPPDQRDRYVLALRNLRLKFVAELPRADD